VSTVLAAGGLFTLGMLLAVLAAAYVLGLLP
jgi:hypothetical protein